MACPQYLLRYTSLHAHAPAHAHAHRPPSVFTNSKVCSTMLRSLTFST